MADLQELMGGFPEEVEPGVSRRGFLGMGALACAALLSARPSVAALLPGERRLSFFNTHTGETLRTVYSVGSEYEPQALRDIDRILRDHRTGEVKAMDPRLLDLLHALQGRLGATGPFHVISGYRSPATNAILRKTGGGVGGKSLHMAGKAIDIRLPGTGLSDLRRAARGLKAGGVGYYPSSDFVHVDTGRVRYW
jgi:uncharacterized protein YcbK (DUF882 family)